MTPYLPQPSADMNQIGLLALMGLEILLFVMGALKEFCGALAGYKLQFWP